MKGFGGEEFVAAYDQNCDLRVKSGPRLIVFLVTLTLTQPVVAQTVPAIHVAADTDAPCEALARAARRVPASDWAREEAALAPTLHLETRWASDYPTKLPTDPVKRTIAASPEVAAAVSLSPVAGLFIEHARETDLYQAFTVQGTLHEQESAFIQAAANGAIRLLPSPKSAIGGEWSTTEDLGEVEGIPVIVDHGRNSATRLDQDIQLTPWGRKGFGPACRVALRFAVKYTVVGQFCGDPGVCRAAASIAVGVVRKFDGQDRWGEDEFHFGPPASPAAKALASSDKPLGPSGVIEFPIFGARNQPAPSWSGNDFTPFPVVLNGRTFTAAVGHEGVAWRAGTTLLLAVYAAQGKPPTPLAGFIIEKTIAALKTATVVAPVLDRSRP